jgi:rod shape-determining protein MreC
MDSLNSGGRSFLPKVSTLGLKTLFLGLISGGLIYADGHTAYFKDTRAAVAKVIYPLQRVVAFPQDIAAMFEHFHTRETLLEENRQLRQHELEMSAQLSRMQSFEAETNRMKELLGASDTLGQKVRIVEILSLAQDPYRQQIVISKGDGDGVYRGQALVDAHGVMGQVVQVNPTSSVVLLITDANHGIPVQLNRTGLQTIALGRGDGQTLSLPFLSSNADVKVGDLIVSSGLGGRFPTGYPVGQISELHHQPGEHFTEALAWPAAQINQSRQALLIWGEHPEADLAAPAEPAKNPGRKR